VLVFAADAAMAFNVREGYAQWLEWLNGNADLARALPVWWRETEAPLFRGIGIWSAAAVGGWLALRALDRFRRLDRGDLVVAATLIYAAAASAAVTITWAAERVPGRLTTASQLEALRTVSSERRVLPLRLSPFGSLRREDVAAAVRIQPERATGLGGAGRNDRPLFSLPAMPAGEYSLRPVVSGVDGWLLIGIGRDQFSIQSVPLDRARAGLNVQFPVDVRALIVRGDEDARRGVAVLEVQPVRVFLPEERLTSAYARHAVRYGNATTYFLDEESYPEPSGFWVGGQRTSEMVIHPDEPHPIEVLLVRSGAADCVVLIEANGWREELRLGAGEERRVEVPMDLARGATLIRVTTSTGFTPSAIDPQSRDHRFLGAWITRAH
jgi:hypothetical protein